MIALNRRRYMGGGGGVLPYEAELDWLGIRQNTYILTDFVPTGNDITIEARIGFVGYPTTTNYAIWFVARTGANYRSYRMIRGTANNSIAFNCDNNDSYGTSLTFTPQANIVYDINLSFGSLTINNKSYSLSTNTSGSENTSALQIGDHSLTRGVNENIFYFKVYKGGVLKVDLIPVRVGQAGYLYDKISGMMFGNSGTGDLVLGPDKNNVYIEWLKSLGCVTWLPLLQGDLEDKITGQILRYDGNGSITWDSTKSMYKINTPSSGAIGTYTAKLNGFSKSLFPNDIFTILGTIEKITSTSGYYYNEQPSVITSGSSGDTLNALGIATYNGSSLSTNIPIGVHKYGKAVKDSERLLYYDGSLNMTSSGVSGVLPSNWETTENGLIFGRRNSVVNYYIKDVYIFNTYLPLSIIRQIQGYDPLP